MHPWHHYVAIGDSFTEGIGDSVDGFAKLGAMDWMAAALRQSNPDLRYTNLAKRGLLIAEIREQQLETALGLKPDLVSVVAGANDILKGKFEATRWEQELRTLYESLTQTGAAVSTGNVPHMPYVRTLKEPRQMRIKSDIAQANEIIQRLVAQYRVILVDAWRLSLEYTMEDWSQDGIHLNSRGHFKFAKEILKAIEQQIHVKVGEIKAL